MTTTSRRGFLGAILAFGAAPAIASQGSLMKLWVPQPLVLWGDGVHDDTAAFQAWADGGRVVSKIGLAQMGRLVGGTYLLTEAINFKSGMRRIDGAQLMIKHSAPNTFCVDGDVHLSMSACNMDLTAWRGRRAAFALNTVAGASLAVGPIAAPYQRNATVSMW